MGSIGASHINQVLRNIIGGATSQTCPEICDSDGIISHAMVKAVDPALAAACDQGLAWEVLSYKIEEEEPQGLRCIQSALNERQKAQMMQHEMEVIKTLAKLCEWGSSLSRDAMVEGIRSKMVAAGGGRARWRSPLTSCIFAISCSSRVAWAGSSRIEGRCPLFLCLQSVG